MREKIAEYCLRAALGCIIGGVGIAFAHSTEIGGGLFGAGILLALTARVLIPTTGTWCAQCQKEWGEQEKCPHCGTNLH